MKKLSRQLSLTKLLSKKSKKSSSASVSDSNAASSPLTQQGGEHASAAAGASARPSSPDHRNVAVSSVVSANSPSKRRSSTFSSDFRNASLWQTLQEAALQQQSSSGTTNSPLSSGTLSPGSSPLFAAQESQNLTWTPYNQLNLSNLEELTFSLLHNDSMLRTLYRSLSDDAETNPHYLETVGVSLSRLVIRLGCPALYFEKLLKLEFERVAEKGTVSRILLSSSLLTKSLDYFISQPEYHQYLRDVLLPPLASLITEQHEISFELLSTNSPSQNLTNLIKYLHLFLERIFDNQTIIDMPFAIRFIAKQIALLSEQYNNSTSITQSLIGNFIICRLFSPSIIAPDMNGFLSDTISASQRNNLLILTDVLEMLSFQSVYTVDDAPHMMALNEFLTSNFKRFGQFLNDLPPADMLLRMQRKREKTMFDRVMQQKHLTYPPETSEDVLAFDESNIRQSPEDDLRMIVNVIGAHERTFQQVFRCSVAELKQMLQNGQVKEQVEIERLAEDGQHLQNKSQQVAGNNSGRDTVSVHVRSVVEQAIQNVLDKTVSGEGEKPAAMGYTQQQDHATPSKIPQDTSKAHETTITTASTVVKISPATNTLKPHQKPEPQSASSNIATQHSDHVQQTTETIADEYSVILEKARNTIINQRNEMEEVRQHLLASENDTPDRKGAPSHLELELRLKESTHTIRSLEQQLFDSRDREYELEQRLTQKEKEFQKLLEEKGQNSDMKTAKNSNSAAGTQIQVVIGGKTYVGFVHPVAVETMTAPEQKPKTPEPVSVAAIQPAQPPYDQKPHAPKKTHTKRSKNPKSKSNSKVSASMNPITPPQEQQKPSNHHQHKKPSLTTALAALHQLASLDSQSEISKIVKAGGVEKVLKIAQKYASSSQFSESLSAPVFGALTNLSIHSSLAAEKVASSENGIEKLMRHLTTAIPLVTGPANELPLVTRAYEALAQISLHSEVGLLKIHAGGVGLNVLFGTLKRQLLAVHTHPDRYDNDDVLQCLLTYTRLVQALEEGTHSHEHENSLLQFVFSLAQQALQEGHVSLCRVYVNLVFLMSTGERDTGKIPPHPSSLQKRLSLLASQQNISYMIEIFSRILSVYSSTKSDIDDTQILEMLLNILFSLLKEDPKHMGAMRIDLLMHCGAVGQIFHCMRLFMDKPQAVGVLDKCVDLLSQFSERLFYDKQLQEEMIEGLDVLLTANTTTHTSVDFKLRITRIIHELMIPNSSDFEDRFMELHGVLFVINNVEECVLLGRAHEAKDDVEETKSGSGSNVGDALLFWLDECLSILLLMVSHQRFQKHSDQVKDKLRRTTECMDRMRYIVKKFEHTNVATKAHEVLMKIEE